MTATKLIDLLILPQSALTAFQPSKAKAMTEKMVAMLKNPSCVRFAMFVCTLAMKVEMCTQRPGV